MRKKKWTRNSIIGQGLRKDKQTIKRAKKNPNPLRGGKNVEVTGKKGQTQRVQFAETKAFYNASVKLGLRPKNEDSFNIDTRKLNFKNNKQIDKFLHYNNATSQFNRLNDRANSFRQSFKTRAEELGISQKVMQNFDDRFSELGNFELLQTLNKNMEKNNITFDETFGSDQPFTEDQQMKQLINMYRVLGIGDQVEFLSFNDINSGFVDNSNFTHYDFEQANRKERRRELGRV